MAEDKKSAWESCTRNKCNKCFYGSPLGCKGVISVLSNVLPYETHKMCADYLNGNINTASDAQIKYIGLIKALFCDVNPIPVKKAMNMLGWNAGACRLPLVEPDERVTELLRAQISDCGIHK